MRRLAKILLYVVAALLGTIVVVLLAANIALDRVPRYQAQIKDWVQLSTGYRITFARVSPAFRWYGPELYFERLDLRSRDGSRSLAGAAGGRVGLDLLQSLQSGKLLAGRVELDAPEVTLTRVGLAHFTLASEIDLDGGDTAKAAPSLEDLPAGRLAIRGGTVTIRDWNAALPQLQLRDVNLDMHRVPGSATLSLTFRLPASLGGPFSLNGMATGHGRLDTLAWNAWSAADGLTLAGWHDLFPAYLGRVNGGTGGFEVAARGNGFGLARADLELDAQGVATQLSEGPSVKFDRIAGAFTVTHAGELWTFRGRRLRAVRDGERDPPAEFDASIRGGNAGLLEVRARASYLRAETLLPLAGLLPQKEVRDRLQLLEPTGRWFNTEIEMTRRAVSDPWKFRTVAKFQGVGFAPFGRLPGLRGLSGNIEGTDSGGRLDIDTAGGVFAWPVQLTQTVTLQSLKTTLYWKRDAAELLIATPSIEFSNQDVRVQGQAAWRQSASGGSPEVTLVLGLDDGNMADTRLYLPQALLPAPAFAWLNRAFIAGHMAHGDVVLQGPVRHFPFRDGTGVFFARLHSDDLTLDYGDGWPRATKLALTADFRNEGLEVHIQRGSLGTMAIGEGNARFADFKTGELKLNVALHGDAAEALEFLRTSPVDAMAENAFSTVEGHGPMQADLDLYLPFRNLTDRRVGVHAEFLGVSLLRAGLPMATELRGDADIDGAQVARADVHGMLLGGPFQMQSRAPRSGPVTHTLLLFNGTLNGEALRSALSIPSSAGTVLAGTAEWHGSLKMVPDPARERALHLTSNLLGLELALPEPLTKATSQPLAASLDVQWPASAGTQLRVGLGTIGRAQLTFDAGGAGGAGGAQIKHATVTFGDAPEVPESDSLIAAGGRIDRLDLGGWLKFYTPDSASRPIGTVLRTSKFQVAQLDYLGFSFLDLALTVAPERSGWRINVGGPNAAGSITLPGAEEATPWSLEFQRLKFATEAPEPHDNPAATAMPTVITPKNIPALDFHAAEVIWGERQLGDLHIVLGKLADGVTMSRLAMIGLSFTGSASGEWRGPDAGSAHLTGEFASGDLGASLRELGYDSVIEAKSAEITFDMHWQGAPTATALALAAGQVHVGVDKGQLTGVKPGAGRVLGLASVAALPRRLALDFSDLTDKGFAFDTIRGSFALRDGSASTEDLLIKGPAADIGLIGRVGLKNQDYDQTAVVTGNVSSTLALPAFAGGPIVGAAALVFTQVFKQPLRGLVRGYYRITGNWENPTIERVKSADAATATAEASK